MKTAVLHTEGIEVAPGGIAVVGLIHHKSIASSLGELAGPRLEATLAGFLIMLLVLVPFFAFRVLSKALGGGRLARMFFVEREPMEWRQIMPR
jgi:hypothetical protein